ncbi:glycosyltransferase family 4 protein [Chengkuizengella axinellae]|uniref:Glycosyltransferase family 4 protein n=1 Tax=Chengkuizengella axinellae TaxID=3064388 RepID=A0ABT9IZH6_9BACL|nr:glycosyltransferase family 4 protein [Chengkuizengella sp. 2205SS18-9]MDP5274715.1 glycosyltransferase family 4 protein [Chengkuizengella sp. 2205SS18-9]
MQNTLLNMMNNESIVSSENHKVLHISTIDITITKMLMDKMKELQKLGYEVDFMSTDTGLAAEIELEGFKHIPVHISRSIHIIEDIKSILEVYKLLKNSNYDIVHTHTAKAGFIGRVAAFLAGKKIVAHTSHGLPFYKGQSTLSYHLYKWLEKTASWFSHAYFSQNVEDLKTIQKFVPKKLLTGYEGNGVPLEKLDLIPRLNDSEKTSLKKSMGLSQNEFIFLMGARMEPVKNHKMLIQAVNQMNQDLNFKVILAGEGILKQSIVDLADELGIRNKIIFLGYTENIYNYIQIADAVLLTSEKEGIPRIIMESMVFLKPVLATNVLGTKELVTDSETGELVELNDVSTLARRMSEWMEEQSQSKLMEYGINARKRIEDHFTEAIVAQRIHQYYETLLKIPHRNTYHEKRAETL